MKVDFWQLSRDPADRVVAMIAARVLSQGERLLVVTGDPQQRQALSTALWAHGVDSFLANGIAGEGDEPRQPILISADCEAANGASHVIFADGVWREEAQAFQRSFLLFGEATLQDARACWRALDGTEDLERSFYRQEDGKWVKVA